MYKIFIFTCMAEIPCSPAQATEQDWHWAAAREIILHNLHLPGVECRFMPILKPEGCTGEEPARLMIRQAVEQAQSEADAILFSHKPQEERAIAELLAEARLRWEKPVVLTSLGTDGDLQPPTILKHLLVGLMLAPQLSAGLYKLENNRAVEL